MFLCLSRLLLALIVGQCAAVRKKYNQDVAAMRSDQVSNSFLNCPPAVLEDWMNRSLEILRDLGNGHVHLSCKYSLVHEHKASCIPEECGGDEWCFVKLGCAESWFSSGCEKIPQPESMPCKTEPDYEFGPQHWEGLSFSKRWEAFRGAVPLDVFQDHWDQTGTKETGPACQPSLVGPEDSKKLAIVMHGFTACPATHFPMTRRLLDAGFRVMLPTLPGHGRKYSKGKVTICDLNEEEKDDSGDGCGGNTTEASYTDDLTSFPVEPGQYYFFAEALGMLAEQFKKEHPDGLVVMAGHSLGGLVSAKAAMERPHVVDRLLLISPMLGLTANFANPLMRMGKDIRLHWSLLGDAEGQLCEQMRGNNSGGNCQFHMGNVVAMADFAHLVGCREWGLEQACKSYTEGVAAGSVLASGFAHLPRTLGLSIFRLARLTRAIGLGASVGMGFQPLLGLTVELGVGYLIGSKVGDMLADHLSQKHIDNKTTAEAIRKGFGSIKQMQVVTTWGDPAIDNWRIHGLVEEVGKQQEKKQNRSHISLCHWPSDLGHGYNNDRDVPGRDTWFHSYAQDSMANFLTEGRYIDYVEEGDGWAGHLTTKHPRMCMQSKDQVHGNMLTVLPANQREAYKVADPSGGTVEVDVLFSGPARKYSGRWKLYSRTYETELLKIGDHNIIATRKRANDTIRRLFVIRGFAHARTCATLEVAEVAAQEPLMPQLMKGELEALPYTRRFCGQPLLDALCTQFRCAQ